MSRSLAAAFVTEKNLVHGPRPLMSAIFHFGGAVGDVYITDRDITISGNAHKGCVDRWGEWQSLSEQRDGTFQVMSQSMSLINKAIFGSPVKRFTDLWSGIGIEGVEVDIYQNFRQVGTTTILQELLFAGVCRPGEYTPYYCDMDIVSVCEKYLPKTEISWPITHGDLPLADPDDVGKRANFIYGNVKGVRCHAVKAGLQSPLQEAMSAVSGYIHIAQDYYDVLPATGTVQIGDEQIAYGSKTTDPNPRLVSLTRGSGSTPIQSHAKDDNIVQVLTEYIYLVAGHASKSVSNIKIWRNGLGYPLTGSSINLANTTLIPGKTVTTVTVPVPPTIKELPVVTISDSQALQDNISVNDAIGVDRTGALTDGISVIDNIGVVKVGAVTENIGVSQPNTESKWDQAASDETITFPAATLLVNNPQDVNINFSAQEKTKSSGSFKKSLSVALSLGGAFNGFTGGIEVYLVKADNSTILLFKNGVAVAAMPATVVESVFWGLKLRRLNISGSTMNAPAGTASVGSKTVVYSIDATVSKTGTVQDGANPSKTGSAIKDGAATENITPVKIGAATKQGTVALTGATTLSSTTTAEIVLGEYMTCDTEGQKDDGSGTYTGSASALIEKPADVLHHLARAVGGIPVGRIDTAAFVTARGDAPASYKFSAVLGERSNLKELLIAMGMQSRIRVDWPADKLTCRFNKSSYGAPAKTLTQENVMEDGQGKTTLKIKRSAPDDLLNVVNLYFGRDWTKAKSRDAFAKVANASDATSISKYGTREHIDRFLFEFIGSDNETMATDLRDYYLAFYKEPKRIISFDCKLDQYELLPGDVVALAYYSSVFPVGQTFAPSADPLIFDTSTFASGKVSERFDGLTGDQKFLIEEMRHMPGAARDNRSTRMAVVMREVA